MIIVRWNIKELESTCPVRGERLGVPADRADALGGLSDRVHRCSICANLTEGYPCDICADNRRDHALVCVVEEASDIGAIERAGEFPVDERALAGVLARFVYAGLVVQRARPFALPKADRHPRGFAPGRR